MFQQFASRIRICSSHENSALHLPCEQILDCRPHVTQVICDDPHYVPVQAKENTHIRNSPQHIICSCDLAAKLFQSTFSLLILLEVVARTPPYPVIVCPSSRSSKGAADPSTITDSYSINPLTIHTVFVFLQFDFVIVNKCYINSQLNSSLLIAVAMLIQLFIKMRSRTVTHAWSSVENVYPNFKFPRLLRSLIQKFPAVQLYTSQVK